VLTFARDWSAALATSTAARAVCFGAVMSSPDHGASSYEVAQARRLDVDGPDEPLQQVVVSTGPGPVSTGPAIQVESSLAMRVCNF